MLILKPERNIWLRFKYYIKLSYNRVLNFFVFNSFKGHQNTDALDFYRKHESNNPKCLSGLMEMRKKLTSGEKPEKIRRIEDRPSTSKQSQNSSEFSDDEDFSTQCYIIDLKTALNEKDAKILKLQKKIEKLEREKALWTFEVDFVGN